MMEAIHNFCHNVHYLRNRNNLSQKEMAQIMGISVSKLRRIEQKNPKVKVYGSMLCSLCDYFDISADEMLRTKFEE